MLMGAFGFRGRPPGVGAERHQPPFLLRSLMMVTTISRRECNQNTSSAKKAAAHSPVHITDRGRCAHEL